MFTSSYSVISVLTVLKFFLPQLINSLLFLPEKKKSKNLLNSAIIKVVECSSIEVFKDKN